MVVWLAAWLFVPRVTLHFAQASVSVTPRAKRLGTFLGVFVRSRLRGRGLFDTSMLIPGSTGQMANSRLHMTEQSRQSKSTGLSVLQADRYATFITIPCIHESAFKPKSTWESALKQKSTWESARKPNSTWESVFTPNTTWESAFKPESTWESVLKPNSTWEKKQQQKMKINESNQNA